MLTRAELVGKQQGGLLLQFRVKKDCQYNNSYNGIIMRLPFIEEDNNFNPVIHQSQKKRRFLLLVHDLTAY